MNFKVKQLEGGGQVESVENTANRLTDKISNQIMDHEGGNFDLRKTIPMKNDSLQNAVKGPYDKANLYLIKLIW